MSQFNRRKFLVTGAAVLGASGIVAGIGWWYRARRSGRAHCGRALSFSFNPIEGASPCKPNC